MPRLKKRTVITAAFQANEGIFTNPADATDTLFLVQDVVFKAEPTIIVRDFIGQSFAAKGPAAVTNKLARITFRTEIMGSGTAGTEPKWSRFIKACGFKTTTVASVSNTYNPVVPSTLAYDGTGATGNTALSIEVHEDGLVRSARDCRGTFRITAEAGSLAYIDWEFMGIYNGEADAAYPVLSTGFDNQTPPIFESALAAWHGVAASVILFRTWNFELGNVLSPRFDANTASGLRSIFINDRKSTSTVDPETPLLADWTTGSVGRLIAGTTGAFAVTVGGTAGNRLAFSSPSALAQVTDVSEGDRDSIRADTLTFAFNAPMNESDASTADDDIQLSLT